MPAEFHPLDIDSGETYLLSVQITDDSTPPVLIDLTDYSGEMAARIHTDSPTRVFTVSTAGGGMTITPETGTIQFEIPATLTALMTPENVDVKLEYDVWLTTPAGKKDPIMYGQINARARIVRP